MIIRFLTILFMQLSVVFASFLPQAVAASSVAAQTGQRGFTMREPNLYAPHFYADKIDFIATLVDLPGAKKKQSHWELSYQLYFIPEDTYYEALRRLRKSGSNPTPEQFSGRILLAEGHKRKPRLATLRDRTIVLTGVPFKQKVPDAQRTKFAYLMTGYSVKIFDAALNTTVYRSGIFLTEPFEANSDDQKQASARKTIYLSFAVNPDGVLNYSQAAPKTSDTTRQ